MGKLQNILYRKEKLYTYVEICEVWSEREYKYANLWNRQRILELNITTVYSGVEVSVYVSASICGNILFELNVIEICMSAESGKYSIEEIWCLIVA